MKKSFNLLVLSLLCVLSMEFAQAQGKFSGYMFGDWYYNVARDSAFTPPHAAPGKTALSGPKDLNGFQFRRIYFAYDNDISEKFTSRFRLEADQTALSGTKILPVVKDAYLKWKDIMSGSDLTFGIQPTTAFDISEGAWGYRMLEKTIIDLRGVVPSRDFGLSLRGKVDDGGMLNYWAMVSNGDGNSPNTSKYHRYAANIDVKPVDKLQIDVNVDYRALPSINDIKSTTAPRATVSNSIMTLSGFVGYKDTDFSLGAEVFSSSQANNFVDASGSQVSLTQFGFSLWGSYNLQSDLALVARFDQYDPNNSSDATGDARSYIIGGLSWKADKNVSIIPNIQYESYQAPASGSAPDASVNARITFYYIFL